MLSALNQQIRAASLGFWPGTPGAAPASVFDGDLGPRSQAAIAAATAFQRQRGLPFVHPSGIVRIHWHWTVGHHKAGAADRLHYHWVFEGDGTEIACHPESEILAHTLNCNTGALGLSLCGMVGARENPFTAGPEPFTPAALAAMIHRTALLTQKYDIPVSRLSTLSHAEVSTSLGVLQKGKWDIAWLPGQAMPLPPVSVGDRQRAMVLAERVRLGFDNPPEDGP